MAELMLPNLLGAYNQGIETRRQNALMLQKQQQAQMQEAQALAIQNELARSDDPYSADVMNRLSRMPGGLDVVEKLAKAQEARGKGMQESTKGIEGRMQYWKRLIPADPRLAPNWVRSAYNDPVVGPELKKLGTADEVIASLPQDPNQYMKWVEGASMFADEVAKRRTPSAESMMPYVTPKSPAVMNQEIAKAAAGKTSVNVGVNTSKKFGETLAEGAGKRLDSFRDNAEQAVRAMETNKRLKPLLDDPKFISGTFADARTAVARALGMDVSTTEAFFSGMAEQVASRIKAFGAGSGLSNADREYALAWAGGKPDLSAEGIARIMKINDQSAKYAVKKYNEERSFLGKTQPEVFNYYPEVTTETANSGSRTVVRTGTDTVTGKKVVQYSDGTTEYAP